MVVVAKGQCANTVAAGTGAAPFPASGLAQ